VHVTDEYLPDARGLDGRLLQLHLRSLAAVEEPRICIEAEGDAAHSSRERRDARGGAYKVSRSGQDKERRGEVL
jgi:hypothetical protein